MTYATWKIGWLSVGLKRENMRNLTLTSGPWNDRNEVRLTGSIDGTPLVETINGKLVAKFFVHTIVAKRCTRHRIVASGELAKRVAALRRGDLIKVAGRLEGNSEIVAWQVIEHTTEGKNVIHGLANADIPF